MQTVQGTQATSVLDSFNYELEAKSSKALGGVCFFLDKTCTTLGCIPPWVHMPGYIFVLVLTKPLMIVCESYKLRDWRADEKTIL